MNILFFDGDCILCNNAIDFLLKHDRHHALKFATLQGKTAKTMLPNSLNPTSNDQNKQIYSTVILLTNTQIQIKSTAVINAIAQLGGPWKLIKLLNLIPKSIRDYVYQQIAKNRQNWFGKRPTCRRPNQDEAPYFLD